MRRRKLVILLAALIFGLAACTKPAEPSPVAVSSVLALSSEQSAPAQTPEGQEKPAEPEHEWTQEDIRALADYMDAIMKENAVCVVGNGQTIEENKEMFGTIENLFH